jgi:hypothetical protein
LAGGSTLLAVSANTGLIIVHGVVPLIGGSFVRAALKAILLLSSLDAVAVTSLLTIVRLELHIAPDLSCSGRSA